MSKDLESRVRGGQPPLPLVEAPPPPGAPAGGSADGTPADGDAEWRLDEHTRLVGRQGIAAARALLRSSPGRSGAGRPARPPSDAGTGRRSPGRAA
jgi:hypothetical protein